MIDLELLRNWVKAEIKAAIADNEPGPDGYYGGGYNIELLKMTDELFEKLKNSVEGD